MSVYSEAAKKESFHFSSLYTDILDWIQSKILNVKRFKYIYYKTLNEYNVKFWMSSVQSWMSSIQSWMSSVNNFWMSYMQVLNKLSKKFWLNQ